MNEQAWQDRKLKEGWEPIANLTLNPNNPKIHPQRQTAAIKGAIRQIGWLAKVKVNLRSDEAWKDLQGKPVVIDGHDRIKAAKQDGQTRVPVEYYDLTPDEEDLFLISFDYIGTLFHHDREAVKGLMDSLDVEDDDLANVLTRHAEEVGAILKRNEELEINFQNLDTESPTQNNSQIPQFSIPGADNSMGEIQENTPDRKQPQQITNYENQVRMVQLFFNQKTVEEFSAIVEFFNQKLGTKNNTDCVLEVMRYARNTFE